MWKIAPALLLSVKSPFLYSRSECSPLKAHQPQAQVKHDVNAFSVQFAYVLYPYALRSQSHIHWAVFRGPVDQMKADRGERLGLSEAEKCFCSAGGHWRSGANRALARGSPWLMGEEGSLGDWIAVTGPMRWCVETGQESRNRDAPVGRLAVDSRGGWKERAGKESLARRIGGGKKWSVRRSKTWV